MCVCNDRAYRYAYMFFVYDVVLLFLITIFRCAMFPPYSSCSLYVLPFPPPSIDEFPLFFVLISSGPTAVWAGGPLIA